MLGAALPWSAQAATARPYFDTADWYWLPPAGQKLASQSATWAGYLTQGKHVCLVHDFGATVVMPGVTTSSTPTYDIAFDHQGDWGDPFPSRMPVPAGLVAPPMVTTYGDAGDSHVAVAHRATGTVYSLWQSRPGPNPRAAAYGGVANLRGDGTENQGSSTASRISLLAGVIRVDEMRDAVANGTDLGHTLIFSSDIASPAYVYPARKSDGNNGGRVATPMPQGSRVVLDPAASLAGLKGPELVIAKTLQKYGAVLGDKGGSRMSFVFEFQPDGNPGAAWSGMGLSDYQDLKDIPWSRLRVLNNWNGS